MKYIKTYEVKREKRKGYNTFYYIPYNEHDLIRLVLNTKLDVDKKVKDEIIGELEQYIFQGLETNGFFLGVLPKNIDSTYQYYACDNDKKKGYETFIKDEYRYGGEIKLDQFQLDAMKYNL